MNPFFASSVSLPASPTITSLAVALSVLLLSPVELYLPLLTTMTVSHSMPWNILPWVTRIPLYPLERKMVREGPWVLEGAAYRVGVP